MSLCLSFRIRTIWFSLFAFVLNYALWISQGKDPNAIWENEILLIYTVPESQIFLNIVHAFWNSMVSKKFIQYWFESLPCIPHCLIHYSFGLFISFVRYPARRPSKMPAYNLASLNCRNFCYENKFWTFFINGNNKIIHQSKFNMKR